MTVEDSGSRNQIGDVAADKAIVASTLHVHGDIVLAARADVPAAPLAHVDQGPLHNLPVHRPIFVGRRDDLDALHQLLQGTGQVGLTQPPAVSAAGGIGKTALALEYAFRCVSSGDPWYDTYPGGTFFIQAASTSLPPALAELAPLLGVAVHPTQLATAEAVKRRLEHNTTKDGSSRPSLLIIDNVISALHWNDASWKQWLPGLHCRVLITTRDAYLAGARMSVLGRLSPSDGLALLSSYRGDATSPQHRATAEAIVEWFGGLAIGLATLGAFATLPGAPAWEGIARALSAKGLGAVELAEQRLAQEAGSANPIPDYDARVSAVVRDVFVRLDAAERRAMDYASLFPQDSIYHPYLRRLLDESTDLTLPEPLDPSRTGADEVLARLLDLRLLEAATDKADLRLHAVRRDWLLGDMRSINDNIEVLFLTLERLVIARAHECSDAASQSLYRAELTPLVSLVTMLRDHGRLNIAATAAHALEKPLRELGRHVQSLALFRPFVEAGPHVEPELDGSLLGSCWNGYGCALFWLGKSEEALGAIQRSLDLRRQAFAGDHPDTARSISDLGVVMNGLGRLRQAEALFRDSLAMRRRLFPGDHPDVAISLNNLTGPIDARIRSKEAEALLRESLAMRRRLTPGDHPEAAIALINLAAVLGTVGRGIEAEKLAREALEMRQRLISGDHPEVAITLNTYGSMLGKIGRIEEAEIWLKESVQMSKRLFSGDHPRVATQLLNWARMLKQQNVSITRARELAEEAVNMLRRLYPGGHRDIVTGLSLLGNILWMLDRKVAARQLVDEAYAMASTVMEPGDLDRKNVDDARRLVGLSATSAVKKRFKPRN